MKYQTSRILKAGTLLLISGLIAGQTTVLGNQPEDPQTATRLAGQASEQAKSLTTKASALGKVSLEEIKKQTAELKALDADTMKALKSASPSEVAQLQKTVLVKKKSLIENLIQIQKESYQEFSSTAQSLQDVLGSYSEAGGAMNRFIKQTEKVAQQKQEGHKIALDWKVVLEQLKATDRTASNYWELRKKAGTAKANLTEIAIKMSSNKRIAALYESYQRAIETNKTAVIQVQDYLDQVSSIYREQTLKLEGELAVLDVQMEGTRIFTAMAGLADFASGIATAEGVILDLPEIGANFGIPEGIFDTQNLPQIQSSFSDEELLKLFLE